MNEEKKTTLTSHFSTAFNTRKQLSNVYVVLGEKKKVTQLQYTIQGMV